MKPPKLLYLGELPESLAARLRAAAPGLLLVEATSAAAAMAEAEEAEIIAGSGRYFAREMVDRAARLKWVQALSAGVERFAPALMDRPDVTLTNARGAHAVPIGEHFVAMALSLAHRLPEFQAQKERRLWQRLELHEVRGEPALVLGLGYLGREVAARAAAIGMDVSGYDPYVTGAPAGVRRVWEADQLHAALGAAKHVVSCVPLSPSTKWMLGTAEFAAMPAGSYFYNLSRGGVVDEDALVEALASGHLAGAGLDVFAVEPLPETSPLWEMPNVIITPHIAAATPVTTQRVEDILVDNLRRYAAGRPLVNVVSVERGF